MLQAVAPPMMAAPAFAALMGFDATLVLATLVVSTALTPLTAPLFAYFLVGPVLTLSPALLGLKLLAILAGSPPAALIGRRLFRAAPPPPPQEPPRAAHNRAALLLLSARHQPRSRRVR